MSPHGTLRAAGAGSATRRPGRGGRMLGLGLRLAVSGGREALVRLVVLAVAVGLGAGLLLIAVAGINAVNAQNDRYAWLDTAGSPQSHEPGARSAGAHHESAPPASASRAPTWLLVTTDEFGRQDITRVDLAATGPSSPVPPGIPADPGPGQYYVSPALAALLRATPANELADRYPGTQAGVIGEAGLPAPGTLLIVIGHAPAQLPGTTGATKVTAFNTTPLFSCSRSCAGHFGISASSMDLLLSVIALALLAPVLIFIGTATRLSAARREQRFAAMRLVGATQRQISALSAVESTVAAAAGAVVGFGLFFALRDPMAAIPFTGAPFYPSDLSLTVPDILMVVIGVPALAAAAARLALRRVRISPLGAARRVTPKPPRWWRVIPLAAGIAELGFFVVHGPPATISGQARAYTIGGALLIIGLVTAGPWLTMAGARALARRTSSPSGLIAARRLADDPRGAFRAISGLVLALFITTAAVTLATTENAKAPIDWVGPAASGVLIQDFTENVPLLANGQPEPRYLSEAATSAVPVGQLRQIDGVQGIVEVHDVPNLQIPPPVFGSSMRAGVVSCAQLAEIPGYGRCPAGAVTAAFPASLFRNLYLSGYHVNLTLAKVTWPAANVTAARLAALPLDSLNVATNGSTSAIEQARTILDDAYPFLQAPRTLGDKSSAAQVEGYEQLFNVVILASLVIAGCALAASVAGGLSDRKRPFSLLRLTGARLAMLRRVVTLETAVPLLATAAVSIGIGFAASAMYASAELHHPLVAPGTAYYALTAAGIVAALAILVGTFPLLARITGPEVARNE
jgi:hypothetical protein